MFVVSVGDVDVPREDERADDDDASRCVAATTLKAFKAVCRACNR